MKPEQSNASIFKPARATPYVSLFLFLLAVYLLSYTPRISSSDGLAMFSTAESIARRGALDIEQIRWMGLQQGTYGLDGLLYSRKGIGLPVALLPLTWLGLVIPWFGPVGVSLLFNAIVTALTAVLLPAYLQQLGFGSRTGLIVALTFGLTTLAWPYAKSLFSDSFSGLLLLAAAYALLKMSRGAKEQGSRGESITVFKLPPPPLHPCHPARRIRTLASVWGLVKRLRHPFLAGLLLGWNVATRYAEAAFLPVFGLLLLYYLRAKGRERRGGLAQYLLPVLAFITPILLIGLSLVAFNLFRYGDPFNTGYLPNETFSGVLWQGIAGQLISPGRGLLLYSPIFFLSFLGLPSAIRRFHPEAVLALAVILIHLLLYGKWFMWHGGFAWGPRFMIPTLPFWAIFLAPVVARVFGKAGRRLEFGNLQSLISNLKSQILRPVFITLALLGLVPQFLSVTLDFGSFQGSLLDTGLPLFAPQTFFDPHYSPLLHAWAFVSRDSLDLAWAWQGQLNGWLLATLAANILINGFYLKRRLEISPSTTKFLHNEQKVTQRFAEKSESFTTKIKNFVSLRVSSVLLCVTVWLRLVHVRESTNAKASPLFPSLNFLPYLSTLAATVFLLVHTHSLPPKPLQQAIMSLNEAVRPADAVITNDPEAAMPFAELYKGRAPVLGLNNGGFPLPEDVTDRLADTMAGHEQVWWLPNWLPPKESALEQTLLSGGFRARNDDFKGQRLALFAFPDLADQVTTANVTFEDSIKLDRVAYPLNSAAGAAFPIELRWQAVQPVAENYHVFIHFLSGDGQVVTQADGQPVLWTRPTSTWAVGETIVDRYGLWIPPGTTPGAYRLSVGLYRPADGRRLHQSNGEDAAKFEVRVE